MFNILELFYKVNNKNHVSMILVLLTLLLIIPVKINAKMADYSKFDWDNYYENNKYIFGQTCSNADTDENGYCKEDTLLMGQKKFFVRTYKILAKYQNKGLVISDDLVITTALFGLAGEQTGNEIGNEEYKRSYYNKKEGELKAGIIVDDNFNDDDFDADDKFDDNNDSTVSEDEDTALVLIKNSIAYYT